MNAFVETCRELRVLNSVRLNKIGIPITLRQYPFCIMYTWYECIQPHVFSHLIYEIVLLNVFCKDIVGFQVGCLWTGRFDHIWLSSMHSFYFLCICVILYAFYSRLIYHGLYHLALEICDFLKIPPSEGAVKVLRNWALRKVHTLYV